MVNAVFLKVFFTLPIDGSLIAHYISQSNDVSCFLFANALSNVTTFDLFDDK
jgi:hypothetical protein